MLQVILTLIHIVVSLVLIFVVLLQTGKRADLAGAFGGGGSQTAFGTRGAATVLSKITTISAVLFMLTSIGLSVMAARDIRHESAIDAAPVETSAPAPTEEGTVPAAEPEAVPEENNGDPGEQPLEDETAE